MTKKKTTKKKKISEPKKTSSVSKKQRSIFSGRLLPSTLISTFFFVGYAPFASGTWGSLATFIFLFYTLPFSYYLQDTYLLLPFTSYMVMLVTVSILTIFIGTIACHLYLCRTKGKDPKEVVIDEVAGQMITITISFYPFYKLLADHYLLPFKSMLILGALVQFLTFRLFDIWKPSIIGRIDRELPGALGVMFDDVVAGVFAGIVSYAIFASLLII